MAYTPQEWKTGDIITEAKLNHIENGMDHMVMVQDNRPEYDDNAIWIKTSGTEQIEVPTYEEFTNLCNSIASVYSDTKTYKVDDLVFYNGKLYKCIAAITTAEDWDSEKWEETSIIDGSLSIKGAAADGKATGDAVIDLKSTLNKINNKFPVKQTVIDIQDYSLKTVNISSSTGKWATAPAYGSYFIPITDEYEITVTAKQDAISVVALLKTNEYTSGTYPDYATGSERTTIQQGESRTLIIPDDANYLFVLIRTSGSNNFTPTNIIFKTRSDAPTVDDTLTISGDAADAKATGDKIDMILDAISENEVVNMASAASIHGLINISNKWSTSAGFYSYALSINAGQYHSITVTAGENNAIIGILASSTLVNQREPTYATGYDKIVIPSGETKTLVIPSDCVYIVITKEGNSGADYTPASVVFKKWGISSSELLPLGLHEHPKSESALNIVKRCRQLTDVKWTPAVDLYRYMLVQRGVDIPDTAISQNYFGTFKKGIEYTGIPYGRVSGIMNDYGYDFATVAHYIPLETFVSSVSNVNSKLCKEDVHNLGNHRSVLYATVCSGLTCYALNVPEVPTASIHTISGLAQIGKINDNGTEIADSAFQIGDVLNLAGYHTAIVTDIIRNNEGTIQSIELSDASTAGLADRNYSDGQIGGVCRRKGWTRDAIYNPERWGEYTIYRYTGNVPYTPNQYVNVGDEFNMQRIEHFPCMPYEGNKFVYKTGYIPNNAIKILVSLSGYAYLKVFKDGTEISGSPFTVTDETASIDVSEISAGVYKAYLCNITDGNVVNLTYPCEWTILE